tara:strand:+ start:783 stop:950 length:168 start_codon:yes stop_codon:yes gene_type:complete
MIKKNMTGVSHTSIKKRENLAEVRTSSGNAGKIQIALYNEYIQRIFMVVDMHQAI